MKNTIKYFISLFVSGTLLLLLFFWQAPGFAQTVEILIVTSFLFLVFIAFDHFVMKEIDTIEELKKRNIAYAIFLLAFAMVILAAAIVVG